jgi:hypothetical protein
LERLLKEVSRRKINFESEESITNNETSDPFIQRDKPKPLFNCLNWVAQDLFRNNPAHIMKPTSSEAFYVYYIT